jgi:hypothetical protein
MLAPIYRAPHPMLYSTNNNNIKNYITSNFIIYYSTFEFIINESGYTSLPIKSSYPNHYIDYKHLEIQTRPSFACTNNRNSYHSKLKDF